LPRAPPQELAWPLVKCFRRVITGPSFCNAKKALEVLLSAGALFNMVTQDRAVFGAMMGGINLCCEIFVPIIVWDDIETGVVAQQVKDMYQSEYDYTVGADVPVEVYRRDIAPEVGGSAAGGLAALEAAENAKAEAEAAAEAAQALREAQAAASAPSDAVIGMAVVGPAEGLPHVGSENALLAAAIGGGSGRAAAEEGGEASAAGDGDGVRGRRASSLQAAGRKGSSAAGSREEGRQRARSRANSMTQKRLSMAMPLVEEVGGGGSEAEGGGSGAGVAGADTVRAGLGGSPKPGHARAASRDIGSKLGSNQELLPGRLRGGSGQGGAGEYDPLARRRSRAVSIGASSKVHSNADYEDQVESATRARSASKGRKTSMGTVSL